MEEHFGVGILIFNNKNEVLLGERVDAYKAGVFGAPGGRVKLSEPITDAAKRELQEETGLITDSLVYIGVVRELQETYNFIHFAFAIKDFQGEPINMEPNKCKGWQWYSVNNLPDKMLPGHKAMIDMYLYPDTPRYRDIV